METFYLCKVNDFKIMLRKLGEETFKIYQQLYDYCSMHTFHHQVDTDL